MRKINLNKRSKNLFAAIIALTVFGALMLSLFSDFSQSASAGSGIANSVIVQLKDDPGAVWKAKQLKAGNSVSDEQLQAYRNSITAKQNEFLEELKSRGISYEIGGVEIKDFSGVTQMRADYRFNLVLNGIALKIPASAISVIESMPQVKSVKPNNYLRITLDKSVPYIKAPQVYGQFPELTPFDNFREGYEGQGINVAVLDTGIEWQHPMFGSDPTPPRLGIAPPTAIANSNQKVIYYMSFTGGLIDDFGHGSAAASNVAGYLAMAPGADGLPGTGDDVRVHGVAPQAKLMGYKVCTGTGSCLNASTIMAIEDAVSPFTLTMQPKPVAHVINLSLGGSGSPESDTAVAASNAALLGTTVVASAGNAGPGEGTVGAPSAGTHVISVAATTHPGAANANWSVDVLRADAIPQAMVGAVTPAKNLPRQDGFNRIKLYPMVGTPNPPAGSIAQRYALVNMFYLNSTYPASVKGRIALIKDSGWVSATFFDICNSASLNGAVGAILISKTTNPTAVKGPIPCAIVTPEEGEILVDALSSTDDNAVDPPNGALSELPIRMNPTLTDLFVGETASFSSRGPVQGLGQVKPDVTAPGVAVISATVRVGGAQTNGGTMFDPTGYTPASGTSFSAPHVSGMVALVKQAHLDWSPDMIRTALINTSTNLRRSDGSAKNDGSSADSINDQGGGLVDVPAAISTKALMGVAGDGIIVPGILGSHSFGEKPVLNNRINNTFNVNVTIRDVSGQGGTYDLSTVNNRSTDISGVSTSVSQSSISVPAGGSATFTASISIDGNVVRSTDIKQFQWYVVAQSGGKKLRMPMYLQATPTLPSDQNGSVTNTYTGTVLASDAGVQRDNEIYLLKDATYVDVEVPVDASTLKLDATLKWDIAVAEGGNGIPDLDFLLFDPNGNEIGNSGNGDKHERIQANTTIPGTYIYRVYGWANGPTDFTVESTEVRGGSAPAVQPFAADFSSGGERFDFDGNYTLTWQPRGSVEGYEIEESTDGNNWTIVGNVDGNTTSVAFENVSDGKRSYRVRAITPGKIGKYVTIPSNVESITVSRRAPVDATASINPVNKSIVFPAGSTEIVTALKNQSSTIFYPNVFFEIVSVESTGNSVSVANADNGGNGLSKSAVFNYSDKFGADLAPNEESETRMIKFNNPNTVMFNYTVRVIAHVPAGSGSTSGTTSEGSTSGGTSNGGTTSSGTTTTSTSGGLLSGVQLIKFTVNPLTKTVTSQILK